MNCPLIFALCAFFAVSLAQQCGNTHTQSTMISVSIARTSVDKIGRSEYLAIVNEAVNRILPTASSSSHVALSTFGGGGASVSATNSIHTLGNHAYSSLSSSITGLAASANWDVNVANDVGSAILAGNSVLGSASGQKYHLVFTSGNPLQTGFGDGTDPSHPSNPCTAAIEAKQAGIQTYVVLIGEQGVNFVREYYTCVGEFGAADIIVINPASPLYTTLTSKLCKTNGIDMKITEFNPNAGRQFIEVLNRGAPTAIQACFDWMCSTASTIGTGAYFVASEGGYISSGAAGGQIVGSFTGYNFPVAGIYDVSAVSGSLVADKVSYNTGNDNNFQNSFDGRSLELRAIGFNNQYGANWRLSCYESGGAIEGTPGVPAATIGCPLTEYSCTNGDPSAVLSATPLCNNNGGTGLLCTSDGAYGNLCQCSPALYTDVDTCTAMPAPTSTCLGYVLPDPLKVGINWLHLVWDSVEYDGQVTYTITYTDAQQSLSDASRRYAVYATDNYSTNYAVTGVTPPGIGLIAGYDIMNVGTSDETDKLTVPSCTLYTLTPTNCNKYLNTGLVDLAAGNVLTSISLTPYMQIEFDIDIHSLFYSNSTIWGPLSIAGVFQIGDDGVSSYHDRYPQLSIGNRGIGNSENYWNTRFNAQGQIYGKYLDFTVGKYGTTALNLTAVGHHHVFINIEPRTYTVTIDDVSQTLTFGSDWQFPAGFFPVTSSQPGFPAADATLSNICIRGGLHEDGDLSLVDFEHFSTLEYEGQDITIGWLQYAWCDSELQYPAGWSRDSLIDLAQFAVTATVLPVGDVPGVDVNDAVTANICANPVFCLNRGYELSFTVDLATELITGYSNLDNWIGANKQSLLYNFCYSNLGVGSSPRLLSDDILYHACGNTAGVTMGNGLGCLYWTQSYLNAVAQPSFWLGFYADKTKWCQIDGDAYRLMSPPLDGDLRLVDGVGVLGDATYEGRAEVHYNGEWGTICHDFFDSHGAQAMCRQLGYYMVSAYDYNSSSTATGQIWLDNLVCNGDESRIDECNHNEWGVHDCSHSQDVYIRCTDLLSTSAATPPGCNGLVFGSDVLLSIVTDVCMQRFAFGEIFGLDGSEAAAMFTCDSSGDLALTAYASGDCSDAPSNTLDHATIAARCSFYSSYGLHCLPVCSATDCQSLTYSSYNVTSCDDTSDKVLVSEAAFAYDECIAVNGSVSSKLTCSGDTMTMASYSDAACQTEVGNVVNVLPMCNSTTHEYAQLGSTCPTPTPTTYTAPIASIPAQYYFIDIYRSVDVSIANVPLDGEGMPTRFMSNPPAYPYLAFPIRQCSRSGNDQYNIDNWPYQRYTSYSCYVSSYTYAFRCLYDDEETCLSIPCNVNHATWDYAVVSSHNEFGGGKCNEAGATERSETQTLNFMEIDYYIGFQSNDSAGCPGVEYDNQTNQGYQLGATDRFATNVCVAQDDGTFLSARCDINGGDISSYTDATCSGASTPLVIYRSQCSFIFGVNGQFWFRRYKGCFVNGSNIITPTSSPTSEPTSEPTTSDPTTLAPITTANPSRYPTTADDQDEDEDEDEDQDGDVDDGAELQSSDSASADAQTWTAVGTVVAAFLVGLAGVFLVIYCCRKQKNEDEVAVDLDGLLSDSTHNYLLRDDVASDLKLLGYLVLVVQLGCYIVLLMAVWGDAGKHTVPVEVDHTHCGEDEHLDNSVAISDLYCEVNDLQSNLVAIVAGLLIVMSFVAPDVFAALRIFKHNLMVSFLLLVESGVAVLVATLLIFETAEQGAIQVMAAGVGVIFVHDIDEKIKSAVDQIAQRWKCCCCCRKHCPTSNLILLAIYFVVGFAINLFFGSMVYCSANGCN